MKNNIAFLGLGAAGSNVCEVAEKYSYRTAIMNTSPEDLESISSIKDKFLIGTQGGAGKNRRTAKNEVKKYFKEITDYVGDIFNDPNINLIYLVFSASGGTGSGMGPVILDILNKCIPNKKFGAIVILPELDESPTAQFNTLENLNELSRLNVPVLIADNNKFKKKDNRLSKKQLYDIVNRSIISEFENLFRERKSSKYGNMDSRDLMTLLYTPGFTLISTHIINEEISDQESFNKSLINSWDKSVFANMGYDRVVKRMGFIYELPDSMTKFINYDMIQNQTGVALEIFEGFYAPDIVNEHCSYVTSIITGLSFPKDRIETIKKKVEVSKDKININRKPLEIIGTDDNDSFKWFNDSRDDLFGCPDEDDKKDNEFDLASLFQNY